MFGFFKKKQQTMTASVDGKVLPMSEASDEVFSSCALGDGVVIYPTGEVVVAPADGMVSVMMKDSNHAIGLTLEDGTDILIHIGVNTVELKGEGFEAYRSNPHRCFPVQPLPKLPGGLSGSCP